MLHVPLHITKVNDVGGVSLWVSSVFRDTNSLCQALRYRIYSINRPGRLLNFWTLRVGAY